MNSGITRWNVRPSKYGLPFTGSFVFGSVHAFLPVASPTKFATVIGALSGNSSQLMVPFVVSKTASSFVPLPGRPFVYSARSAAVGGRTSPGGGGGAGGIAAAAEPAASGVTAASCFVQGFFAGSIWSAVSGLGSGSFFSQLESASTTISVLHRIAKTLALRSTGDRDQRAADDGVPAVRGPPVR